MKALLTAIGILFMAMAMVAFSPFALAIGAINWIAEKSFKILKKH